MRHNKQATQSTSRRTKQGSHVKPCPTKLTPLERLVRKAFKDKIKWGTKYTYLSKLTIGDTFLLPALPEYTGQVLALGPSSVTILHPDYGRTIISPSTEVVKTGHVRQVHKRKR